MHKRFITISAGALLLAATSPAMSHHPSGTGTSTTGGPIVTIPGTTLQKGASALYLSSNISRSTNSAMPSSKSARRKTSTHSLATLLKAPRLVYPTAPAETATVSVQLPDAVRTGIREASHHHHDEAAEEHSQTAPGKGAEDHEHEEAQTHEEESETVDRGDTDGIGDLTMFGQYRFYGQDAGLQAALLTGLKTRPERPASATIRANCSKRSFSPARAPGTPCLASLCRRLRAGRRSTATSCTRSRRKGRNTPISVTASIIMAR